MLTTEVAGIPVSGVGLGTSSFGKECDEDTAVEIVHAALDCGITFFDTADSYGAGRTGRCEEILGRALRGSRDSVVLATKFGTEFGGRPAAADPERVRSSLLGSLRRLETDHVDLYLLHVPDPAVPIEETLGAMHEVVQDGHARAVGCCNLTTVQLEAAASAADEHGWEPFRCVQDEYSLLVRDAEAGLLPHCRSRGADFICYAPLAAGLLSGKYAGGEVPEHSRLGRMRPAEGRRIRTEANLRRSRAYADFCARRRMRPTQLALAWLLSRPGVSAVIPGATSPEQVRNNAGAGSLTPAGTVWGELEDVLSTADEGGEAAC